MKIAIDGSRAFLENKTGIEEYAYQVIKHLRNKLSGNEVTLYTYVGVKKKIDFDLPKNWRVKEIEARYLWTQLGLSWAMKNDGQDVLFVPAHTLPWLHPKKSVVTVHGLEYEHYPESYSPYSFWFHRFFIRRSCNWANKVITVSQATKSDLKKYYHVKADKMKVIANGFRPQPKIKASKISTEVEKCLGQKFCLFIGRLEPRKNIVNIAKAFDRLRKKHGYEGKLLLVGKKGYGYDKIKREIDNLYSRHFIEELGYVSLEEKWALLKKADIFFFPSLSEGFGIPILEAQSVGTPVITSNYGPMDEVAGDKNVLVPPKNFQRMAKLADKVVTNDRFREKIIRNGLENVKRFSWDKCAQEVAEVLTGKLEEGK